MSKRFNTSQLFARFAFLGISFASFNSQMSFVHAICMDLAIEYEESSEFLAVVF